MGRAPCCDKANVKKGPWSPDEDAKLKAYIAQHGTGGNWIALPQKIGLKRCGKSCRLRWLNYLRPNIKHGGFTEEEENIICSLYLSIGSRWSIIAAQLPGRTDNDIKNYWNTRLKKKLLGRQRREQQARQAISLKQEIMKSESTEISMVSETMNQLHLPYWPQLPIAMPVAKLNQLQELHPNQDSIRTLLAKLGGRFSDDHQQQPNTTTNLQYPFHLPSSQEQPFKNSADTIASSTSMNSSTHSQLPNSTYYVESNMFQAFGFNNFPIELDDTVYSFPQQFDELESFSGVVDNVNASCGTSTTSTESSSWGNASSLVYPPMVCNFNASQQGMLQDCAFQDQSGYFGLQ